MRTTEAFDTVSRAVIIAIEKHQRAAKMAASLTNCGGKERCEPMASPRSAPSAKVRPSRVTKRFTLEQANKSIPYVRRIVQDIVDASTRITELQDHLNELTAAKDQAVVQTELDRKFQRLAELTDELSDVGCELKDPGTGLIDFVARHKGRDVYLCWKLGEQKVDHWHEMNAGFSGRQPVKSLEESA